MTVSYLFHTAVNVSHRLFEDSQSRRRQAAAGIHNRFVPKIRVTS